MSGRDPNTSTPSDRARSWLPPGLIRAGSWGVFDQSIVSGTNFLSMIIAARLLGPSTFGLFAFLVTVLIFLETVQRSLITTPHNVLGVRRSEGYYRTYTGSVLTVQTGLAIVIGTLALIAGIVSLATLDRQNGLMITAMGLAAFFWQFQEFTRRVLYTESRISTAVAADAVTYGARLLLIVVIALAGAANGPAIMLAYAAAWGIGAIVGLTAIRRSLTAGFDRSVIREHWQFGKWLFASNAFSHLPRYVVAMLLSSVLSVAAYGAYRAFEQLANGANVPLTAISNVLRPRIARQARQGPAAVWSLMLPIMVIGGSMLGICAVLLILARRPLVELIYGQEYLEFTAAIALVSLLPFVTFQKSILMKAMQAFGNTRAIFLGTVTGATVGSVFGGLTIVVVGLPAAGAIMLLTGVISTLLLTMVWNRQLRGEMVSSGRGEHEARRAKRT